MWILSVWWLLMSWSLPLWWTPEVQQETPCYYYDAAMGELLGVYMDPGVMPVCPEVGK